MRHRRINLYHRAQFISDREKSAEFWIKNTDFVCFCVVSWHLVSVRVFRVLYDSYLFYAYKSPNQISGHSSWKVSLVIADDHIILIRGLCEHVYITYRYSLNQPKGLKSREERHRRGDKEILGCTCEINTHIAGCRISVYLHFFSMYYAIQDEAPGACRPSSVGRSLLYIACCM